MTAQNKPTNGLQTTPSIWSTPGQIPVVTIGGTLGKAVSYHQSHCDDKILPQGLNPSDKGWYMARNCWFDQQLLPMCHGNGHCICFSFNPMAACPMLKLEPTIGVQCNQCIVVKRICSDFGYHESERSSVVTNHIFHCAIKRQ